MAALRRGRSRIGPPSWHRHGHPNIGFRSERELRGYLGPPGVGREWHHIVEKRLAENGTFPPELIHSTDNIISLPRDLHIYVSTRMSERVDMFQNKVRRFGVEKLSFQDQYDHGIDLIEEAIQKLGYDLNDFIHKL